MALIDSAVDGLVGALISGGVAISLWWSGRGRRSQLDDAWRKQADELDERLTKQHEAERDYLRDQLAASQAETRRHQGEVRRLNQLLNKKRSEGNE